jgi:hypothetical protein
MSERSDISEVVRNCTDRILAALDRISQRIDQAAHKLANHQDNIRRHGIRRTAVQIILRG